MTHGLIQWKDPTMFKQFCLDRIAAGVPLDTIALDSSSYFDRVVSTQDVMAVVTVDEIDARKSELMEEVKESAPIITKEALTTLREVKDLARAAREKFENEVDVNMKDFKTYAGLLELNLKAIDMLAKQLGSLKDDVGEKNIVISFNFGDLSRLKDAGIINITDEDKAKEWLGNGDVIDVEAND